MPPLNLPQYQDSYWRSLSPDTGLPQAASGAGAEFAAPAPAGEGDVPRRDFLKMMALALAAAGLSLTGCRRWPTKEIRPHVSQPEGFLPGQAEHYATILMPALLTAGEPVLDHRGSGAAVAAANRAALLALLQRTDAPLMIGQQIGNPGDCEASYRENIANTAAAWGNRVPMMIGIDYGWEVMDPAGIKRANAVALAHWRRGGLVTFIMDSTNPTTQGGLRSPAGFDLQATLTPGTVSHQRWMADLTVVADGLAELQSHGVAVLWRPLHEANADWFWWGTKGTSTESYRRLWAHMHTFFTIQRRLTNLLWVYAPYSSTHASSTTERYPGAALVDVVGLDVYPDRLDRAAFGGYQELVALGKPVGLAEIGPAKKGRGTFDAVEVLTAIRTHCPQARWALWWNSWGGKGWFNPRQRMSLLENPRAKEMLVDPKLGVLIWKPGPP